MKEIFYFLLLTFALSAILGKVLIPFLYRLKAGQSIREIGPNWHIKKAGTPTMGGMIFILAIAISIFLLSKDKKIFLMFISSLSFGIIGFIDDYIKVVLKRNLGLTASQKFLLQLVASVFFVIYIKLSGIIDDKILIPFLNYELNTMFFLIPFLVFVMLSVVNSVNLTDGLDGLATGVTIVVALFFTISAIVLGNTSVSLFGSALIGGLVGFLIYNAHPAKVFMGDTGSLFLGGAISVMAIILKMPIFLIIVGLVYLIETLSVIIQVISFKLTGKRVFKMSPIHHHFEMCGMNEVKIVWIFTVSTIVLSVIAILGLKAV